MAGVESSFHDSPIDKNQIDDDITIINSPCSLPQTGLYTTRGHKTRHKIHKPGSLTSSSPLNVGSQSRLWSSTAGLRHLRFQKERTTQHAAQAAPPSTSTEHHKTSPADTKEEEAGDHAGGEGSTVGDAGGGGGEGRRGSGCRGEGGGEADPEGGGWQRVTALS